MKRHFLIMALPLVLAACAGRWSTDYTTQLTADVTRGWHVRAVDVSVPESLTVSEANHLAPNANIVWHGDPEGDRRKQVGTILHDGIARGAADLHGKREVTFSVTLEDFHAVTPIAVAKAPTAVHNIRYVIQVFDSRTLQPLTDPIEIHADLPAFTGAAAVVAAQQGQTQKVRIENHLDRVTQSWLGIGEDVRGRFTSIGR